MKKLILTVLVLVMSSSAFANEKGFVSFSVGQGDSDFGDDFSTLDTDNEYKALSLGFFSNNVQFALDFKSMENQNPRFSRDNYDLLRGDISVSWVQRDKDVEKEDGAEPSSNRGLTKTKIALGRLEIVALNAPGTLLKASS